MKITQLAIWLNLPLFLCIILSCDNTNQGSNNNSAEFNAENSDSKAIEIADEVMESMGGKRNWDQTRHISWHFFDSRKHFWDKHTGDVRIEALNNDLKILMNINTMEGRVFKDGSEVTQADSLNKYLEQGKKYWINDSYWLLMPYKLKDPGVTLKYLGEETLEDGSETDVLKLTFEDVGVTPENKYLVYVDQDKKLVTQWAFFRQASQDSPDFKTSWDNYNRYGNILISSQRGERSMSNIATYESLPERIYTSLEPIEDIL